MTQSDPTAADLRRDFPRNDWWVVAESREINSKAPLARRVVGVDVMLYRQTDGTVVALEDRCAHRGLPLSMGCLDNDHVVCGYHGFRYAANGHCVRVPTQHEIPEKARVRRFPIVEQAPFVWIWTGDPALADRIQVPNYPWHQRCGMGVCARTNRNRGKLLAAQGERP
jgi:phenylpropionate dioxygenase-like ring-hydroxylating dioxygenase large terminal subunit